MLVQFKKTCHRYRLPAKEIRHLLRMNILYTIDALGFGGAERQLVELIKELKTSTDFNLHLAATLQNPGGYAPQLTRLKVPVHYLDRRRNTDLIRGVHNLIQLIRRYDIDVIHGFMNIGSLVGALAGRLSGRPVVSSAIRDGKDATFAKKSIKWVVMALSDVMIANSYAGFKNRFRRMRPGFKVIYNGLDLERFKRPADPHFLKQRYGIRSDARVIGTVAALSARKDHQTLLQAFKLISAKRPNTQLLLVGDGSQREQIEAFRRKEGCGADIVLAGHISDVDPIYQLIDVFVLLTNTAVHYEGLSNAIMEAMASGRPVVATAGGGTDEIIQHESNGLLVPAGDPTAVMAAIERLFLNPELGHRLTQNARQTVRNLFDCGRYAQSHIDIYESLAGKYSATAG